MQDNEENDINHLREWFLYEVKGEFSLRAVENKLMLPNTTLDKFIKQGPKNNRGLGANETKVFAWAKQRGYKPDQQYNPII